MSNETNYVRGPGEVISEVALGFRLAAREGRINPIDAQEEFNEALNNIMLFHLRFPDLPWETGSTQVEALRAKEARLNAQESANLKKGK